MRKLILSSAFLLSSSLHAFNVGFNQGWLNDSYAHQWSDRSYDEREAARVLDLAKNAGANTLRMWLFEGPATTSLLWNNGQVSGLSSEFVRNFEHFLRAAKSREIQVYVTLFDANTLKNFATTELRDRWWNLMNNRNGARTSFEKNALTPLLAILYSAEFRATVFGLDVMNEIDAAVAEFRFQNSWTGANQFTCGIRSVVQSKRGSRTAIPVTASIGWPTIPLYHRGAANIILDPNPHYSCVDFWDIHFYSDSGTIENCAKIGQLARNYGKKVYLGEFGQKSKSFDHGLQLRAAQKFVRNAKSCGFSGALAWRLTDARAAEARFSYEAFGSARPAYHFIRSWNRAQ